MKAKERLCECCETNKIKKYKYCRNCGRHINRIASKRIGKYVFQIRRSIKVVVSNIKKLENISKEKGKEMI